MRTLHFEKLKEGFRHVGAVGKRLHRHPRFETDLAEEGRRNRIRRVVLIGVVFDDHAAVHVRAVPGVGVLRVIRMLCVGVVGRDEEALRKRHAILLLRPAERGTDPPQGVGQERGVRTLFGETPNLFVVENDADRHASALLRGQKAPQYAICTLQIIQLRRGDELFRRAQKHTGLAVIEKEVAAQHVFRADARRLRDHALGSERRVQAHGLQNRRSCPLLNGRIPV